MYMVKCSQQTKQVGNASTDNQAMHDLVARAPDIKSIGIPFLWDLHMISLAHVLTRIT
jgi:hypothetical protein